MNIFVLQRKLIRHTRICWWSVPPVPPDPGDDRLKHSYQMKNPTIFWLHRNLLQRKKSDIIYLIALFDKKICHWLIHFNLHYSKHIRTESAMQNSIQPSIFPWTFIIYGNPRWCVIASNITVVQKTTFPGRYTWVCKMHNIQAKELWSLNSILFHCHWQ